MGYRLLTTVIVALHFGFLGYLLFGGFLAWRWPRTGWAHLAAAGWGIAVVVARLNCPLTWAEAWSRQRAGEPAPTSGFIARYVDGVLYPAGYTAVAQAVVVLLVAASWTGLLLRRRAARRIPTTDQRNAPVGKPAARPVGGDHS
ncbi:DUF2784 domain-containing protein [Micromonospora zhanjiangensis]|uniref:DUF2784 domain-containing protein n=1 Tax=Micromonospora zhanjiangensis TaxID=1522057 RepID=A0ABV8KGM8_9ACTN